jgi:hypothetical protein
MDMIEKALGRKIVRIETNDLDDMEDVSSSPASSRVILTILVCAENEKGVEIGKRSSEMPTYFCPVLFCFGLIVF